VKITKNTLKQLIKEELSNLVEAAPAPPRRQTPADIARQEKEVEAAAAAGQSAGREHRGLKTMQVDLLTEIRDLLAQILAKGPV
jgi:hypothetical protein